MSSFLLADCGSTIVAPVRICRHIALTSRCGFESMPDITSAGRQRSRDLTVTPHHTIRSCDPFFVSSGERQTRSTVYVNDAGLPVCRKFLLFIVRISDRRTERGLNGWRVPL